MSYIVLKNFAPGPLDEYRSKATFDWKKLRIFFETEEILEYQEEFYQEYLKHPELHKVPRTLEEERDLALKQYFMIKQCKKLSFEYIFTNNKLPTECTFLMCQISASAGVKSIVSNFLFAFAILSTGTERHKQVLKDLRKDKILGSYCMTEVGHGTNTKGIRTTATYDKKTKEFVLNTPDFEAAKCWAGSLGQTATHGVIYAQLYIDGVCKGLHGFLAQLRCEQSLERLPGITVGDLGEKIGLNGIDNGFMMLHNYRIPRVNLLNRVADVTEDGSYVTPIKDARKRHGVSLGSLSSGRVFIMSICTALGIKAMTIALRYAAVRKQFGPENGPEQSIIEYEVHQHRLFPHLAAIYVTKHFARQLCQDYCDFFMDVLSKNGDNLDERGMEIHALASSGKAISSWLIRDAIQQCRESCGGHGYLRMSGIGNLRNDHDANMTYEGESQVLIQQTTNWLIKFWPAVWKGQKVGTPLHSLDFLTDFLRITNNKFTWNTIEEVSSVECIFESYEFLVCYLLKISALKLEKNQQNGMDSFTSRNNSHVYYGQQLAIAYTENYMLNRFLEKISQCPDQNEKIVLQKLFTLFGLWSLEKHLNVLYEGGFANNSTNSLIRESILRLYSKIKNNAVSLVDALAPPDFLLDSVLGKSDGRVYDNFHKALMKSPDTFQFVNWKKNHKTNINGKL